MKHPLLSVRNICLSHSNILSKGFCLDNISFDLLQGDSISILGNSAAGKTTLMMALLRLHEMDWGEILFKGKNIYKMSRTDSKEYQRFIQPIFQNYDESLNPRLKIFRSILLYANKNRNKQDQLDKIYYLLDILDLRTECLQKYPHQLSGGEKQRISIVVALVANPGIIILDEPFSSLDVINQKTLLEVLTKIKFDFGLSYILITHKIPLVKYFSDNVYLIENNEMLKFGSFDEFYKHWESND